MTASAPIPVSLEFTASDGTVLSIHRYERQTRETRGPVVLMLTPYLKSDVIPPFLPLAELLARGYDCLVVDIRGTGESGGVFLGPLSPREVQDGAELVEWIADQPFCNGAVALAGGSYPGAIQLLIAARRPRGLTCIAPAVAPIDFFRDWTHRGGIPSHTNWGAATFLQSNQPSASVSPALEFYYSVAQSTPEDGQIFAERSPALVLDRIEVPVLFIGGLFDYFGRGTVRGFDAVTAPKRLVLGPWGHQYPDDATELLRWFDYWMRGIGDNPAEGANVSLWTIGRNEWTTSEGRRLPRAHTAVPIAREGIQLPVHETERGWPFEASPSPLPTFMDTGTGSGMHLWGEATTVDLPPMLGAVVEGSPILKLSVRARGCTDADLHARLSIVRSNGDIQQLTEGRLRLSHRRIDPDRSTALPSGEWETVTLAHTRPEPLVPNEFTDVVIELLPTSFALGENERLRIGFSACRTDGRGHPGELEFGYSSALLIPVVDREGDSALARDAGSRR
jgi:predicted acyl esterase